MLRGDAYGLCAKHWTASKSSKALYARLRSSEASVLFVAVVTVAVAVLSEYCHSQFPYFSVHCACLVAEVAVFSISYPHSYNVCTFSTVLLTHFSNLAQKFKTLPLLPPTCLNCPFYGRLRCGSCAQVLPLLLSLLPLFLPLLALFPQTSVCFCGACFMPFPDHAGTACANRRANRTRTLFRIASLPPA